MAKGEVCRKKGAMDLELHTSMPSVLIPDVDVVPHPHENVPEGVEEENRHDK